MKGAGGKGIETGNHLTSNLENADSQKNTRIYEPGNFFRRS
jgi:hypothetical protein